MIVYPDLLILGSAIPSIDRHRLAGVVTVDGQPGSKLICVFERKSRILVAAKWSDPATGAWEIKGLAEYPIRSLFVAAFDEEGNFNAEIADYISQVDSNGECFEIASYYPPYFNDTYIKATSFYSTVYPPYAACVPTNSLIGPSENITWISAASQISNQKFNIDFVSAKIPNRIYLENYHHSGSYVSRGIKNFSVFGTNSADAFNNTTYADETNLTPLGTFTALQHIAVDLAHPQIFLLSNESSLSFRYVVIKIADNYGDASLIGIRHIEFQEIISA